MFGYTHSALMLQAVSKGWKQGPRAGIFSAQPSLSLLQLEPCLIGIVLDHLDYVAFARMAVFVCTFLEKMARAVPVLQPKISLSKSNARTSRC